jgi:hypothetical protein
MGQPRAYTVTPELREEFVALCRKNQVPAAQMLSAFMRDFIKTNSSKTKQLEDKMLKTHPEAKGTNDERCGAECALDIKEVERWLQYRASQNTTAHDYGEHFANEMLKILPAYLLDLRTLIQALQELFNAKT